MIVYNSPDHIEQRVNVKPLSLEEMNFLVKLLNNYIPSDNTGVMEALQSLIWDWENLSHMRETQPKWIDRNSQLPSKNETVLITDGKSVTIGNLSDHHMINCDYKNNNINYLTATHWQYSPEVPIK